MSEAHGACERFSSWLAGERPGRDPGTWRDHLASCAACREQWAVHQMVAATFAGQTLPTLSPEFAVGLRRKIAGARGHRPLGGWRLAALAGYALVSALLLRWVFTRFPVPYPPIDLSSPWVLAVVLAVVPVTLWLSIEASRWLPSPPRRKHPMSLRES